MNNVDCNTTISHGTHFLAAVELIKQARKKFNLASENWPYPTKHKFGMANDKYYAEVWVDGMDWQHNNWIIESCNYENPVANPLISFMSHDDEDKFNLYDFDELIKAVMWLRREEMWLETFDYGRFTDTVWPFLHALEYNHNHKFFKNCWIEHASQQKVRFLMNYSYIKIKQDLKKPKNFSPIMSYISGDGKIVSCPTCNMPCRENKEFSNVKQKNCN